MPVRKVWIHHEAGRGWLRVSSAAPRLLVDTVAWDSAAGALLQPSQPQTSSAHPRLQPFLCGARAMGGWGCFTSRRGAPGDLLDLLHHTVNDYSYPLA